jgi:hypothetical protein
MLKFKKTNVEQNERPALSSRIKRLVTTTVLAGSLLGTGTMQAAVPSSIASRAGAVRDALAERLSECRSESSPYAIGKALPYAETQLAQWVNYWSNWTNWGNWLNY